MRFGLVCFGYDHENVLFGHTHTVRCAFDRVPAGCLLSTPNLGRCVGVLDPFLTVLFLSSRRVTITINKHQGRLYYTVHSKRPTSHEILASIPMRDRPQDENSECDKKQIHFFRIDNELIYKHFFFDFGPLNLGQFARFCKMLDDKLRDFPVVCFYSSLAPAHRANAVFLICAWQILRLDRTPEQTYAGFDPSVAEKLQQHDGTDAEHVSRSPVNLSQGAITVAPLPEFLDSSPSIQCEYGLTVLDCLQAFAKARSHQFFDMVTFDVEKYERFEHVKVRRK